MRVYLPSTFAGLRRLLVHGELGDPPLPAFAVTDALRADYTGADDEELEYVALTRAAAASVRLLDADPDVVRRRVVVAAEVADALVSPATHVDPAAVRVTAAVAMARVVSAHVDDPGAVPDVTAAADAVVAMDLGGEEAAFAFEQAEGHELLWFATQEIGPLVELA